MSDYLTIMMRDKEQCCSRCKHYIQHYGLNKRHQACEAINCGHCMYPRIKHRKPLDTCGNWTAIV